MAAPASTASTTTLAPVGQDLVVPTASTRSPLVTKNLAEMEETVSAKATTDTRATVRPAGQEATVSKLLTGVVTHLVKMEAGVHQPASASTVIVRMAGQEKFVMLDAFHVRLQHSTIEKVEINSAKMEDSAETPATAMNVSAKKATMEATVSMKSMNVLLIHVSMVVTALK